MAPRQARAAATDAPGDRAATEHLASIRHMVTIARDLGAFEYVHGDSHFILRDPAAAAPALGQQRGSAGARAPPGPAGNAPAKGAPHRPTVAPATRQQQGGEVRARPVSAQSSLPDAPAPRQQQGRNLPDAPAPRQQQGRKKTRRRRRSPSTVLRDAARSADFRERLRRKELHRKELRLKLARILRRAARALRMGQADAPEEPTPADAGGPGAGSPAPPSAAPATPTRSIPAACPRSSGLRRARPESPSSPGGFAVVVAEGSVATEGGEKGAKKPRRLSFEEEDEEVEEEDDFEEEYFDFDARINSMY
jgi:hypothetical protein